MWSPTGRIDFRAGNIVHPKDPAVATSQDQALHKPGAPPGSRESGVSLRDVNRRIEGELAVSLEECQKHTNWRECFYFATRSELLHFHKKT
jgi:hypothetical protein